MTTKKYSLRKVKVGVASVLVGFGIATTGAAVANAADEITKLDANTPALTSEEIDALNNSLDQAAKDREETAKNLEKETNEAAAQKEFLANYDKALTASVSELEKAGTTSPEEAKAKADVIAKLKEEAAAKREAFVDGFKSGLTAEDANKLIDEENNPQSTTPVSPENRTFTKDELKKLKEAEKEMEDVLNVIDPLVLPADETPAPAPGHVTAPSNGNDFGQKPEVKAESKAEGKAEGSLPNTGLNSTSTTVAGLGLIALVGLAVRRKLAK